MNNKHESIKKVLKVIGPIILVVGIVLFITTIINMTSMSSDTFGMTVFTGFGGVACIGIGSICTSIGYGREIAKYGVDDVTAQKMANKIKEMIYDDPKASKQTPIMYLPQTWTFEGKTYQYNDNAQADKTENYSDDVKTAMGNMNKDIKY